MQPDEFKTFLETNRFSFDDRHAHFIDTHPNLARLADLLSLLKALDHPPDLEDYVACDLPMLERVTDLYKKIGKHAYERRVTWHAELDSMVKNGIEASELIELQLLVNRAYHAWVDAAHTLNLWNLPNHAFVTEMNDQVSKILDAKKRFFDRARQENTLSRRDGLYIFFQTSLDSSSMMLYRECVLGKLIDLGYFDGPNAKARLFDFAHQRDDVNPPNLYEALMRLGQAGLFKSGYYLDHYMGGTRAQLDKRPRHVASSITSILTVVDIYEITENKSKLDDLLIEDDVATYENFLLFRTACETRRHTTVRRLLLNQFVRDIARKQPPDSVYFRAYQRFYMNPGLFAFFKSSTWHEGDREQILANVAPHIDPLLKDSETMQELIEVFKGIEERLEEGAYTRKRFKT